MTTASAALPSHRDFFKAVVCEIGEWNWAGMSADTMRSVAWAYYYFSVQFRENLEIARRLFPEDEKLAELDAGERNTDNLSPWPGVAVKGEKLNHDEFMRRTLALETLPEARRLRLQQIGTDYLAGTRKHSDLVRAISIASYEDGGLETVFGGMIKADNWHGPLLAAFKHFLVAHIAFDSDPEAGHGALCRHLTPDDRILPLWIAFRDLLLAAAPELASS